MLTWTSDAYEYDVRYSNNSIANEALWNVSQQCLNETASPFNVTGLASDTTYYFRLKARYYGGEWNNMSNQDSAYTNVNYCPYGSNFDFSYMCDNKSAWQSDVDVFPFEDEEDRNNYKECGTEQGGTGGYEDIAANNTAEWETPDPGFGDFQVTWWHMYVVEPLDAVTDIRFWWNGNSDEGTAEHIMWVLKNDSRQYWNNSSSWVQLGDSVSIFEDADTDIIRWINDSSNVSDYMDSRDGKITFLIENSDYAGAAMRTNYAQMRVLYNPICDDDTAPAAIANMNATMNSGISIDLDWIAPGDDNILGKATEYDIRYSTTGWITEGNWDSATQVTNEKPPQVAGTHEYFTVSGLDKAQWYWFAIKTGDEVPLWSKISNSPVSRTLLGWPGYPGPVKDLSAVGTCGNIKLTWTAPGANGYGGGSVDSYDIRYSSSGPIDTAAEWAAATHCTGEPSPQSPGSTETFNQSFAASAAATTYWFAIKSTSGLDTSTLSLASPGAQPNHGDFKGTEWWLYHIYYNNSQGTPEVNSVYHIVNVRAVNQTALVNYSILNYSDVCGFVNYSREGCAIIDWSCDQSGSEMTPTRNRTVSTGLSGFIIPATNDNMMMDNEMYVEGDDATLWVDVNTLQRVFGTLFGSADGDIPTDYLYSYQDDNIPAEDAYPPGPDDGYPFVVGEDDWRQWEWGFADGTNLPTFGDQEHEKGYRWHVDSTVAGYDVDANCEAVNATGTFDVVVVNQTNNYFRTYGSYGQNNSADSDTTQYWYNCSVKNFVRKLDRLTYVGREDWGIVEYETRNISATINDFSDAGSGFDINVTITNNEDKSGNFSVLALIMNMSAVTDEGWSDGEPYPGGETIYPNVSDISSINQAIKYTGNLASGASTYVTWGNVGDSSGTPQYKLWVTGVTDTIN